MNAHPSYALLEPYLIQAPSQAGSFFISYNDLTLSQKWHKVEPYSLVVDRSTNPSDQPGEKAIRLFMLGWRKEEERPRVIVPLALNEPLSTRWFKTTFAALLSHPAYIEANLPQLKLQPPSSTISLSSSTSLPSTSQVIIPGTEGELDPPVLYTATVAKDSSVVYYRIAKGIEKPHDVPE